MDRIPTKNCTECGKLQPADGPHFCRNDRRETLREVQALEVFTDNLIAATDKALQR